MCHMCHNLITDLGQTQSKDLIAEVIVQQSKTQFFKSMKRRVLPRRAVSLMATDCPIQFATGCPVIPLHDGNLALPLRQGEGV